MNPRTRCVLAVALCLSLSPLADLAMSSEASPKGTGPRSLTGAAEGSETAPLPRPPICGSERWAVKTLSDDDAPKLNLDEVTTTTISALNVLPGHCNGGPDRRVYAEEFKVFEVIGHVQLVRGEDDRDVHVVLSDPNAPDQTIVVEVVDPNCSGAADSPHVERLSKAKAMFSALLRSGRPDDPPPLLGRLVRLRGVGFYDFDHGQTGRSQSCIELHPVLSIDLAGAP